jgi:predicted ATPase
LRRPASAHLDRWSSERCPLPNLTSQRKKERTLEALIRQLEGLTRQQPVLMVFEDAHWIDPTSREPLGRERAEYNFPDS